jgi:hypothetical protein
MIFMERIKSGYLGLFAVVIMFHGSCRRGDQKEIDIAYSEMVQPDSSSEKRKQELVGIWKSKMVNRSVSPNWLLTFHPDGSFESFYKPSTYKEGTWDIANDTVLYLCVKEIEKFSILQINDSTLEIRSEDASHYSEVMEREK